MKGRVRTILSFVLIFALTMSLGITAFAAKSAADIAEEMAKNSAAWHEADAATRKELEAANAALREEYAKTTGDDVKYDPATGKTTATK